MIDRLTKRVFAWLWTVKRRSIRLFNFAVTLGVIISYPMFKAIGQRWKRLGSH